MKLSVESKIWKTFAMGLSLAALSSCGEYNNVATTPAARESSPVVEEMHSYSADLQGIQTTSANITGRATMTRTQDELQIMITMNGVSDTAHRQTIRSGRCPVATDDTNGDGSVSSEEAQAVLGTTLLELSNNLSTSAATSTEVALNEEAATDVGTAGTTEEDADSVGTTEFSETDAPATTESTTETTATESTAEENNFPMGSGGTYTYNQTADWSEVGVVEGGELELVGKIVVIEGDDQSASAIVACGDIEQEQSDQDDEGQMPQGDQGQDQGPQDQGQHNQGHQQQQQQQRQHQQHQQHQNQQQNGHHQQTEVKPVESDTVETESPDVSTETTDESEV